MNDLLLNISLFEITRYVLAASNKNMQIDVVTITAKYWHQILQVTHTLAIYLHKSKQ